MGRASSVAKRRYPVARDASPGYSEPDAAVRESRSDGICCPQSVHHTHSVASRLMGTRCSFYPGFASWAIACRRFATHWVERHILRTRDTLSHAVASRLWEFENRPKHWGSTITLDFGQITLYLLQFGDATGGYPFGYKDTAVRCETCVMRMDKFAILPLLGIGPN